MITVVKPELNNKDCAQSRLNRVLEGALAGMSVRFVTDMEAFDSCDFAGSGERLLFAVDLGSYGINPAAFRLLEILRSNPEKLEGCSAAFVCDADSEFYTKSFARQLALAANSAGASLPGKALVEATASLGNFRTVSKLLGLSLEDTYIHQVRALAEKLEAFENDVPVNKIVAVHASERKTSNSLLLWNMVKKQFPENIEVQDISLRNGQLLDCRGCRYEDCLHFGEKGECFYGGVMTEKVFPAVIESDAVVMICPNYNDAAGANLTAFINRLTALFRSNDFSKKKVYALVISGYSGGDIVAQQLIGAMNFNKNFVLPPRFAMIETANDPKSILRVPDIDAKTCEFAKGICTE